VPQVCTRMYLLVREARKIATLASQHIVKWREVKRERERGWKSSLAKERFRDKIASNELSGPDTSLMRIAEIISGRDRTARAYAFPPAIHASLFSRDLGRRTRPYFRRSWRTSRLSSLCLSLTLATRGLQPSFLLLYERL